MKDMKSWHLYLVRTRFRALYVGVTTDPRRRFEEHCGANGKGAKYLRSRGPLTLVYQTKIGSRSLAAEGRTFAQKTAKEKKRADCFGKTGSGSAFKHFETSAAKLDSHFYFSDALAHDFCYSPFDLDAFWSASFVLAVNP